MRGSLKSPPILACRQGDCVYTIHNAFIVRGGSIRVQLSEFIRLQNPSGYNFTLFFK